MNTYIYELIFKKCTDFSTQVRLARAFPEFLDDAIRIWRKSHYFKTVGPQSNFLLILSDIPDYLFFMRHMAPHFQKFYMYTLEYNDAEFKNLRQFLLYLKCIRLETFPSITYGKLVSFENGIKDEDILDLSKMMPNLKTLHIKCTSCSGAHLENFKNLEELHIGRKYNYELAATSQKNQIQKIVTTMHNLRVLEIRGKGLGLSDIHLPNLEILTLHQSTLSTIFNQVIVLPRLQKLNVYGKQKYGELLFVDMLRIKAHKITGVLIDNSSLKLNENWDKEFGRIEFPKLRKIVFKNWKYSKSFLSGHKFDHGQIETIDCENWSWLGEAELTKMIKDHHNLQKLGISKCRIEKSVVKSIELFLKYENEMITKLRKTSMISTMKYTNLRPKLFLLGFCDFWKSLKTEEIIYWKNNQYVEMQPAKGSIYHSKSYAYKFEFDTA